MSGDSIAVLYEIATLESAKAHIDKALAILTHSPFWAERVLLDRALLLIVQAQDAYKARGAE